MLYDELTCRYQVNHDHAHWFCVYMLTSRGIDSWNATVIDVQD